MRYTGKNNDLLSVVETDSVEGIKAAIEGIEGLMLFWCLEGELSLKVEMVPYSIVQHQIIYLSDYKNFHLVGTGRVRVIKFNRPFYCIVDHDSQVGCKGLLFLTSTILPTIALDDAHQQHFQNLWNVLTFEMQSDDNLQLEMLQMLVKRLLIMSTRIYKEQSIPEATHPATELIRIFSSLVEQNYKQGHSVSFYADLLNKSPKTITNLFAQAHYQSPSEIIQERLHLEAVRLLKYTDKSIKEIAFELGYEDLPSFSRFFRNKSGHSPRDFRVHTTI